MSLSNYPPGVTGREPQITGIDDPEDVIDYCSGELKKADNIIDDILTYLDDQNAGLSAKAEADILEALEAFRDEVESKRPDEYDPYDDRI